MKPLSEDPASLSGGLESLLEYLDSLSEGLKPLPEDLASLSRGLKPLSEDLEPLPDLKPLSSGGAELGETVKGGSGPEEVCTAILWPVKRSICFTSEISFE